jgi:hypothetical protein
MKIITPYIPRKGENFHSKPGFGYTGKGKGTQSYKKLQDGSKIAIWVEQLGGTDAAINLVTLLIKNNYDAFPLSRYLNISPQTCKKFIKNNLSGEMILMEKRIRLANSKLRKSLNLKGLPSKLKGKSYKEIHGDKEVACGFRKGDKNPNFTRDKYIGCMLSNSSGKSFRSSYEVKFSELLESNNVSYEYEHHFKLCNGKVKIVDFIVNNYLVEITGYAYEKWKQDFDIKVNLLHISYPDKRLIIISTNDKIQELYTKHGNYAIILDLNDSESILKTLV